MIINSKFQLNLSIIAITTTIKRNGVIKHVNFNVLWLLKTEPINLNFLARSNHTQLLKK